MKKTLLLALGLFAAAAFAKDVPPDVKPSIEFGKLDGVITADIKTVIQIAPGKARTIEQLNATEVERDTLRQQLAETGNAANILKNQRNELASQTLDLSAQLQLLRSEIERLKAAPVTPAK